MDDAKNPATGPTGQGSESRQQTNFKSNSTRGKPFGQGASPTLEEIQSALHTISPDCSRHEWAQIAMSLKSELGESGFSLFDDWSRGGKSYNPGDCRDTWKSIRPDGGTTIRTLFGMARAAGWRWTASRTGQQGNLSGRATTKHDPETEWAACLQDLQDHVYLPWKAVLAFGLRLYRGPLVISGMVCDGALAMLLVNCIGKAMSIQFISPTGEKRFLPGCPKKGAFHVIGTLTEIIVICEGYATGATIYMATGYMVIVAVDSGNLLPVSQTIRAMYPHHTIILAADDDHHLPNNPGLKKATEAAAAIGGYLATPEFGPDRLEGATDFNDLAAHLGMDAVKMQLAGAKRVEPEAATQTTPQGNGPGKHAVLRCMNDMQSMAIRWMWFGRIARGKLTLLVGPPGTAKSQITALMAATVTRGHHWPDGADCLPGKVVILSAEDDPEDTIRPRLEAVDANLSKVFILEAIHDTDKQGRPVARSFKLSEDLAALDAELSSIGGVVLVVVDPISAYLGAADSHNNAEVRALLSPLSELAAKHGAAVVAVSHLNKGAGSAIDRVTGSGAFVAAARASYLVCKDRDDPHRRLFLPMKNNLGNDSTGLAFHVEGVTLQSGIETSRISWEPDPVTVTADDALAGQVNPAERGAMAEAKTFLIDTLKDGPKTARSVRGEVEDAGLSWATVRRAQLMLGVKPYKNAYQGKFMWALPSGGASNDAQSCSSSPAPKSMSIIGKNEHHRPTSEHHSTNNNNNNSNSKMVREDQWCSSKPNDAHVAHGRESEQHSDELDYEEF